MEGQYVHLDLLSKDPKATRAFFEGAFGWKFDDVPFAGYALWEAKGPPHGGLRGAEPTERAGMIGYVAVDSLADARARVEKAGGRVIGDVQEIPGYGAFFLFEAPGGVVQGAFEEKR